MVKNLDNDEIEDYLEKSDFLISEGYGPGIPIFLSKGIEVVNYFNSLFIDALLKVDVEFDNFDCQQLVSKQSFETLYYQINDYLDEVLSFEENLLMSDPLVQTLDKIKENIKTNNSNVGVLTISAIFRDKSRGLIPLFKDRNIYPVVQLDQGIYLDDFFINLEKLKRLYYTFYQSIGIKICFLEAKEVPEYAEYELYFLSSLNSDFTKLGMVYKLSSQFNKNYNIVDNISLVNSGFSGKTLFMSIKNFSESYCELAIPPFLTPVKVFLVYDNAENKALIEDSLDKLEITYISNEHSKRSYQEWKKTNIFFFILVHRFYTLHERDGKVTEFISLDTLLKYVEVNLKEAVNSSFIYSEQKLESNLSNKSKNICLDCWKEDYYGLIILDEEIKCDKCGKKIDRAIFIVDPKNRFY